MPVKFPVIQTFSNHSFFPLDLNRLSLKDSLSLIALSNRGWFFISLFSSHTTQGLPGQEVELGFFLIPISTYQQFLLESPYSFEITPFSLPSSHCYNSLTSSSLLSSAKEDGFCFHGLLPSTIASCWMISTPMWMNHLLSLVFSFLTSSPPKTSSPFQVELPLLRSNPTSQLLKWKLQTSYSLTTTSYHRPN